jgi:Kyakuja-Dileera-Zisupton transposase
MNCVPIDKPADDAPIREAQHRRYDRVFMAYGQGSGSNNSDVRTARAKFLQKVKHTLSEDTSCGCLNDTEITWLIDCLPRDDAVRIVMRKFLTNMYLSPVQLSLATLHNLLCVNNDLDSVSLSQISAYAPEIACLLKVASSHNVVPEIVKFVTYLTQFVGHVHSLDEPTCKPDLVASTYNPESGTAYYFTESGHAVRTMPRYKVGDDNDSSTCNKIYPQVSYGGFAHTLLWFCPIHGHCYGFHVINGSEGRKDPFASLVKYMPVAPDEVFYDFACSLSEYCLNREPEFFRGTRFWHDIFHGYSHKCSKSFCSTRIRSLRHMNSEICEQFNAYIQCIKYTASHLSQSHFTFFLQFFIYQWNLQKTEVFFQQAVTAMNGAN